MAKAEITDATEKTPGTDADLYLLTDVLIDTLGLVERGAVNETFFLLKTEEGLMSESTETKEVSSPLEALGIERLRALITKGQQAEIEEAVKAKSKGGKQVSKMLSAEAQAGLKALLDSYGDEMPDDIAEMLAGLLVEDEEMEMSEGKAKTKKSQEVKKMAKEEKPVLPAQEPTPIQEAPVEKGPDYSDLLARLEKAEAAQVRLEKVEAELVKAREIARQEREARELITHIEKAREFTGLGIQPDEMGSFLHRLAQADEVANLEKAADAPDRSALYEYITAVLKAASAQIVEAGFYKEAGSAKVDLKGATLIEKAKAKVATGEYPDLRAALMAANQEEVKHYLAQFEN